MFKRLLVVFLLLLIIAVAAASWGYRDYQNFLSTPLTLPQQGLAFTIEPGTAVKTVAKQLEQQGVLNEPRAGVIRPSLYLQLYARLSKQATQIKAGDYRLLAPMTPVELLATFVEGKVIQFSLTIPEGWTFRQMMQAVLSHEHIEKTLQGLDDMAIMTKLGYPDQHPEGRFFPNTYHFPAATTDVEFLKRAYQTMQEQLQKAWQQRADNLPLNSAYEALIMASIIEKETGLASERGQISGVFNRRLQKGMRLQTDPTVIYGMGESFDGNIRRRDLRQDTPYNTYTRDGLPPTPIALPGRAALQAAVNPEPGETLFFVAKGDGSGAHVFSKTLREHNRAVRTYQLKR